MIRQQKPGVSIVIPTYHRNDTLRKAVSSALAQTYPNIELVVVDDNPPESAWRTATQEILAEFAGDPRLRVVENEKNLGGALSRNAGILASSNEYIAFLDDDDEYMPERVERQLPVFLKSNNEKLALVFCDAEMTFGRDVFMCYSRPRYKGCCLFEAMRDNCLAATSQWMVKKSALLKVGMFSNVSSKQDSTLILKLLAAGFEVDYVPEVLSRYCFYSMPRISGLSLKNYRAEKAYYARCRELFDRLTEEEQREVRYSFAKIFYRLSKANGDEEKEKEALHYMMKVKPAETVGDFIRNGMRKARWTVFPNGLPGEPGRG
ncbi:MAG: glycosyltransferase [Lachnospiraceae bacterium]|nr:glycosyltransferase [Lachnospiraceae bacterium]